MNDVDTTLAALRGRPLGFLFRYIRLHPIGHAIIMVAAGRTPRGF